MARKVLATLSKHFVEVQDYDYEPGSPSHKWSSKKIVTAFQKDLTDLITAATTAFISVAATLTATSLFKHCVKVFKPIIMQLAKRIQKKLNGNTTKEEPSG